jgi:hypothetical protein
MRFTGLPYSEDESRRRPSVLMAATLYWPLSARLAIRFLECGCGVSAICPPGHYLRYVDGIENCFSYRGLGSLGSLERAIRESKPTMVIPCDDRIVWQLHELHRRFPDLRSPIESSLGSASAFGLIDQRAALLETAQSIGISIPETRQIRSEQDLSRWFGESNAPAVLKMDGTWAGEGVAIVRSAQEATEAFRRFSTPIGLMTTCKRFLVNQDPLAFWDWSRRNRRSISIQRWIDGQPANSMLACWKGEVLSIVSVEVLASEGQTGAAFLVRTMEDERMIRDARLLAHKLQLSGFCGLDYLLEKSTRVPYLIEVNPRCTQLGHLPLARGRDLANALCAQLTGQMSAHDREAIEGRVVAFFPQAERWAGRSTLPRAAYTDIPRSQPGLLSELMRPAWPQRQWISRIYHHFYPARRSEPVEFRAGDGDVSASHEEQTWTQPMGIFHG